MNYNINDEPVYKDLPTIYKSNVEPEPIVIDFSRGTKDISLERVNKIIEELKLRLAK